MTPSPWLRRYIPAILLASGLLGVASLPVQASSHREAPFITRIPKVDGADFYMFRSYEPGRDGFVTLVAEYIPLQSAYGAASSDDSEPQSIDATATITIDHKDAPPIS